MFGHIDLVLIDEAHLLSPNDMTMYRTFLRGLMAINPLLKVVGFTATPWRLGHGHLTDPSVDDKGREIPSLFTDVCFDITGLQAFNRLIDEGYLVPLIPKRTKLELSIAGIHTRGGELIEKEMQASFDREEITEAALREAIEIAHAQGRKRWLIFASGTDHADNVGDMLNMMGIPTGVVHSKRDGRDQTIKDFKAGKLTAVVNNNVLTTGFDYPEIDLIIVLRGTLSTVLWVQMLGRGTRPVYADGFDLNSIEQRLAAIQASGKTDCLVLDFARNTSRLGPVNDPVIPRMKGREGGPVPVKICDVCETYNHISARKCINCGAEFTFEVKFKAQASTDDLIKAPMPIVKVFNIDHISCDIHTKIGSPPMMKLTYYCGVKSFTEFVCIEHQNFAGRKARQWWKERTDMPYPASTEQAMGLLGALVTPTQMRVWTNKQYPEIMAFCFDGTSFGTQEAAGGGLEIEVRQPARSTVYGGTDLDDDVPF
jgi:DNA repair protein RadD